MGRPVQRKKQVIRDGVIIYDIPELNLDEDTRKKVKEVLEWHGNELLRITREMHDEISKVKKKSWQEHMRVQSEKRLPRTKEVELHNKLVEKLNSINLGEENLRRLRVFLRVHTNHAIGEVYTIFKRGYKKPERFEIRMK
ncbi:MAG: hypothetical protein J7L23_00615 [Candidatus Diapherotrites archaeon]|nr:hypothetical protein [Candidatus Diapherotrites archaeon]